MCVCFILDNVLSIYLELTHKKKDMRDLKILFCACKSDQIFYLKFEKFVFVIFKDNS